MGKDKDKRKSGKSKNGESGKEKKSHKEKKKSVKTKPKSNKSKVVNLSAPKSKDKSNKTSPKSKGNKSSGKKSAKANSNKSKPQSKLIPVVKKAKTKPPPKHQKAEIPKSKNKSEKSQVDEVRSVFSSSASACHDEDHVVKIIKKEKPVLVKKFQVKQNVKKKSPLKSNKEKEKKPPFPQSTKKTIVKLSKVLSESTESVEKENSKALEDTELEMNTSVDHSSKTESTPEKSAGQKEKLKEEEERTPEKESGESETVNSATEQAVSQLPTEPEAFTKPTVNQPKGRKEALPMCYSPNIGTNEFEALYDEITDLNSGATTLKHSYGSIVTSLVHMNNRRLAKHKVAKNEKKTPQQINFMTTRSEVSAKTAEQMEGCLDGVDKYDMERFINPVTRDKTFQLLFDEIEELNKKTQKLRTEFFDDAANFLRDKYDHQKKYKIERKQFNQYKLWTKKLLTVVDDISRTYNDDLLNMFRID